MAKQKKNPRSKNLKQLPELKEIVSTEKPITPTQKQRFNYAQIFLLSAIIAIAVLTFFAKQYAFFSFDLYITLFFQSINNPVFSNLLLFITWLGNATQAVISVGMGCIVFLLLRRRDFALSLLISSVGAVTIAEALKQFVSRPRPDATLINQIEQFTRNDSFPSGHVLYYMGFYGFLLFACAVLIKKKLWRNIVMGVLLLMIALVGISRIYKGSHWFSDTLGAYLIGAVWLYFIILIFKKIQVQSK